MNRVARANTDTNRAVCSPSKHGYLTTLILFCQVIQPSQTSHCSVEWTCDGYVTFYQHVPILTSNVILLGIAAGNVFYDDNMKRYLLS